MTQQHNFVLSPGALIPEDGGYVILSGLSRLFPFLHGKKHIQIAPVRGRRVHACPGKVRLDDHSLLCVRGLTEAQADSMGGAVFDVLGQAVTLGTPVLRPLVARPTLVSRLVIFDNAVMPADFLQALVAAAPLGCSMHLARRRTVYFKKITHIGYGVRLEDLTPAQSLDVQSHGLGRFTSMGCGVFGSASRVTEEER